MSAADKQRKQYLMTQVTTASQEQLVVMLFDGIIRFSEAAHTAYSATPPELEVGNKAVERAQAIVMELLYTLNREKGGSVAEHLAMLHAYAFKCLMNAHFKRELDKIKEVVHIYTELRESWVAAMASLGLATSSATATATPTMRATATPAAPVPASMASTVLLPPGAMTPAASRPTAPAEAAKQTQYGLNSAVIAAAAARKRALASTAVAPLSVPSSDTDASAGTATPPVNPLAVAAAMAQRAKAASTPAAPENTANATEDPAAAHPATASATVTPAAMAQYAQRIAMLAASAIREDGHDVAEPSAPLSPAMGKAAMAMAAYQRKFA